MEKLDLTKILENCPKGWKFYSTIFGEETYLLHVDDYKGNPCPITIYGKLGECVTYKISRNGHPFADNYGECCLYPSKEMRDWSKFTAPWYKKEKFDPKTLEPFDKVLIKSYDDIIWRATLFSHIVEIHDDVTRMDYIECVTSYCTSTYCIPYNDETKHLLGTEDEAPEYYRYWVN